MNTSPAQLPSQPVAKAGGGQVALRGFMLQTLYAVLQMLQAQSMLSLTMEPDEGEEKFDYLWQDAQGLRHAVQVKSSINAFENSHAEKWTQELAGKPGADSYRLLLLGDADNKLRARLKESAMIGGVEVECRALDYPGLQAQAAQQVAQFIERQGWPSLHASVLQEAVASLCQRLLDKALRAHALTAQELHALLRSTVEKHGAHLLPSQLPRWLRPLSERIALLQSGFKAYSTPGKQAYVPLLVEDRQPAGLIAHSRRSEYHLNVLAGPGGVGKTRLLLETCQQARALGMQVLWLDADSVAKGEDWQRYLEAFGSAEVWLALDYLEKCTWFVSLVEALVVCNQGGACIHLLATCRSSERDSLADVADWLKIFKLSEDLNRAANVTSAILGPELVEFVEDCRNVPVFATFLRFLHASGERLNQAEIAQSGGFDNWLTTHFLQFKRDKKDMRLLAAQTSAMAALPADITQLQAMSADSEFAAWLQRVQDDGWLYSEQDAAGNWHWHGAHDVLADCCLRKHLQDPNAAFKAAQLLRQALAQDTVSNLFTALRRVQKDVAHVNWEQVLQNQQPALRPFLSGLLRSEVLTPTQALRWLDAYGDERQALARQEVVLGMLENLLRQEDVGLEPSLLWPWVDAALEHEARSVLLLSLALRHALERYWPLAMMHLTQRTVDFSMQYVLVSCLRARPVPQTCAALAEVVRNWVREFGRSGQATHVFHAWLRAGGSADMVQASIKAWCACPGYALRPEAHFVYKAWLDAGLGGGWIEQYVQAWCQEHGVTSEARFVYKSWLDAGLGGGWIEEYVQAWCQEHGLTPEADFVYKSWLDAGLGGGWIEKYVQAWCQEHGLTPEARFVYQAWLDAGLGGGWIEEYVQAWCQEHGLNPEAGFVYKAWLDAGLGGGWIEEYVQAWCQEHGVTPEAGFVYQAWLDAGLGGGWIEEYVQAWCQEHGLTPEADFVYKTWLEAGMALATIEVPMRNWLRHQDHAVAAGAGFIYRAFGERQGDLDDELFACACRWLQVHSGEEDAVYCMKFVAGDARLDGLTCAAILDWVRRFPRHEDALDRLGRLHFTALKEADPLDLCMLTLAVTQNLVLQGLAAGGCGRLLAAYLHVGKKAVQCGLRDASVRQMFLPVAQALAGQLCAMQPQQFAGLRAFVPILADGGLSALLGILLYEGQPLDARLPQQIYLLRKEFECIGEDGEAEWQRLTYLLNHFPVQRISAETPD